MKLTDVVKLFLLLVTFKVYRLEAAATTLRTMDSSLRAKFIRVANLLTEIQASAAGEVPQMYYLQTLLLTITDVNEANSYSLRLTDAAGNVVSGQTVGKLIGEVIKYLGSLLGGEHGVCGNSKGIFILEHTGVFGALLDTLGRLLGPLANDQQTGVETDARIVEVVRLLNEIRNSNKNNPEILRLADGMLHLLGPLKPNPRPFNMIDTDGRTHYGGAIGDIVGNLFILVATAFAGSTGICGTPLGTFFNQGQGLLGFLIQTFKL